MLGTQSIGVRLFRSAREKKTRLRFPEIIDLGARRRQLLQQTTTYGGGDGGQHDKEDEDDAEEEGTEEVL